MKLGELKKTKSEIAAEVVQTIMNSLEQDRLDEAQRYRKVLNNFSLNRSKIQKITLKTSDMSQKNKEELVTALKKIFRYRAKHQKQEIEFGRTGDLVLTKIGIQGKLINPFLKNLRELQSQYNFTIKEVT